MLFGDYSIIVGDYNKFRKRLTGLFISVSQLRTLRSITVEVGANNFGDLVAEQCVHLQQLRHLSHYLFARGCISSDLVTSSGVSHLAKLSQCPSLTSLSLDLRFNLGISAEVIQGLSEWNSFGNSPISISISVTFIR